ncbi:MAG: sugar ABC transporter permease [Firmicutes bacterium]|nr:sugar ABC transporter permease [Bacillota bacterium]
MRKRLFSKQQMVETAVAYLCLSPFLILFGIFTVYAVIHAFSMSFYDYSVFTTPVFIGLANYVELFGSELFRKAMGNTFTYAVVTVAMQTILALLVANLLNRKLVGRAFFRAAFYVPAVTPSVVISLIFTWMFFRDGIFNYALGLLGIHSNVDWLNNVQAALPAVIIVGIWSNVGRYMLIFLAGLQDIPRSVYEAAEIDGATGFHSFRYITVPLLRPIVTLVAILGAIGAFQVFTEIYIMTGGGPMNATTTVSYLIYINAFNYFRMGYASAIAWVLAFVIFAFSTAQRKVLDVEIYY